MSLNLESLFSSARFILVRYEANCCPGAGLVAVLRQEQQALKKRAVAVAPWSGRMETAKRALEAGKVKDTDNRLPVHISSQYNVNVSVLAARECGGMTLYLAAEGYFQGEQSPYDTPDLHRDALLFGLAVAALFEAAKAPRSVVAWCAEWQCAPAASLLCDCCQIVTALHSLHDEHLGRAASAFEDGALGVFQQGRTALQILLDISDIVVGVSRGFVWSMANEPIYRNVLAPHLQSQLKRVVSCQNAAFLSPSLHHNQLADEIEGCPRTGAARLKELQTAARGNLPEKLRHRCDGRVIIAIMGRLAPQKLHIVAVLSIREILKRRPELPVHFVFAVSSDADSASRLDRIKILTAEFPDHVSYFDKRISFFDHLMAAAAGQILPSLFEPHGGAFYGTVLPIARCIDGLAAQIIPRRPITSAVAAVANCWHGPCAEPNGFLFREDVAYTSDLCQLVEGVQDLPNATLQAMAVALEPVLEDAIDLFVNESKRTEHAKLVLAALRAQQSRSWEQNIGVIEGLLEAASSGLLVRR